MYAGGMIKKVVFVVLFGSVLLGTLFGGNIYVQDRKYGAIKVYVTDRKYDADLVVYVADYKSEARGKDEIWYFEKYKSSADAVICIVDYKSEADLKIYYARYKSEAGWRKSNKYVGRLR